MSLLLCVNYFALNFRDKLEISSSGCFSCLYPISRAVCQTRASPTSREKELDKDPYSLNRHRDDRHQSDHQPQCRHQSITPRSQQSDYDKDWKFKMEDDVLTQSSITHLQKMKDTLDEKTFQKQRKEKTWNSDMLKTSVDKASTGLKSPSTFKTSKFDGRIRAFQLPDARQPPRIVTFAQGTLGTRAYR